MNNIKIALAGNPNSGKSTIFNGLTGANQHVGNYPGVTVELKSGEYKFQGTNVSVIDLPGTYTLNTNSPEEAIARNEIIEQPLDLIVNVIDASNIERNLYLTLQLLELGVPILLVLNMMDTAKNKGMKISPEIISKRLYSPVTVTIGYKATGITELKEAIAKFAGNSAGNIYKINQHDLGCDLADCIRELASLLKTAELPTPTLPVSWYAIKLLEKDEIIIRQLRDRNSEELLESCSETIKKFERHIGEDSEIAVAEHRYGIITGIFRESVITSIENRQDISEKIDSIVTNRILGLPLFFLLMYGVFWLTFTVGDPFMGWIEDGFSYITAMLNSVWQSESMLKSLIIDGAIAGVGGVLIFLPNIILLFLAIALLEGTGYMSRVAFIMDKLMHKVGMHGKSFIPMIIGFGCSVPAIMATRTLESRRDRLTTMLVAPLMSCGARIPIYALIIPVFFHESMYATIMWIIYFIGIVLAIVCAKILRSTVFKGDDVPFVMELPPYRIPTFTSIVIHMWQRAGLYLKKAGTVILAISIILWIASTYPQKKDFSKDYAAERVKIQESTLPQEKKAEFLTKLRNEESAERMEYTVTGRVGSLLEPIIKPLGFDWHVGTALVGALAAKEVFVSQLGIVYSIGDADSNSEALRSIISKNYTALQGFCIMLFCLISAPCVATIATTRRESNSWKWAAFQLIGLTVLAYIITFIVYQVGSLIL